METLFVQCLDVKAEVEDVNDPLMVDEANFDKKADVWKSIAEKAKHAETSARSSCAEVFCCGLIDVEIKGNSKTYRLKCIECDVTFTISNVESFIEHLEKSHHKEKFAISNVKEEIEEPVETQEQCEVVDEAYTNDESNDDSSAPDELEIDESDEPKTKRHRKNEDNSISLYKSDKEVVLNFLNVIKSYAILWYNRKLAPEQYDDALKEFSTTFNKEYPKKMHMTEDQIRKSICAIKDLYQRTTDTTHKRHIKNSSIKVKFSEYFKICTEIEAKSKTISSKCDVCGITFIKSIDLQVHRFRMHQLGELPFKCKICGAGFSKLSQLSVHEKKQHIEKKVYTPTEYVCEICGKIFSCQYQLKRHMLHHQPPQEKCEICGKMLYNKYTLSEHMKAHRNDRQYSCTICQKTFNTQNGLYLHRRQVHKIVTEYIWASTPMGVEYKKIETEYKPKNNKKSC